MHFLDNHRVSVTREYGVTLGPATDHRLTEVGRSLREQVFKVAETQADPEAEPQGLADRVCRKPAVLEQHRVHESFRLA
jgi:hypothetical protein